MDQEMNQSADGVLAVCNRKNNDKHPTTFYADRVTVGEDTVQYSDIETINLYGAETTTNLFFKDYSAYMVLKTTEGKKLKWKTAGVSVFGIGGVKVKRQLFANLFITAMNTVVRDRAQRYLKQILNGAAVTIGNISVNSREITGKSGFKKVVTVPISELGNSEVEAGVVKIYKNDMEKYAVNAVSIQEDNAVCLVPIIRTLIALGKEQAQQ